MNTVLVAFSPGTSGRFISTISYMLENNLNKEIKWSKDNSAHNVEIDEEIKPLPKELIFVSKKIWQVKYIHYYPDFNKIKNKISNCKFIIIGFTEDNITEVVFNQFLKNAPEKSDSLINVSKMLLEPFRRIGNINEDPFYQNIIVPEQYKEDILVIMYDDIYKEENNSFIVLEKISKFLNKPINEYILKTYKEYVNGQRQKLQEYKEYIDKHKQLLQENNINKT
jgi:hypothetical protein